MHFPSDDLKVRPSGGYTRIAMNSPKHAHPGLLLLSTILLVGLVGCQGAGSATAPSPDADNATLPSGSLPYDAQTGVGMMMLYAGEADLDGRVSLSPIKARQAGAIGDAFIVDLTSILAEGEPCGDCVRLTDIEIEGTRLILTLALRHPFPLGPTPGQGAVGARNDLHVMDVRGYIVPQSNGPAPINFTNVALDTVGNGQRDDSARAIAGHLLNPTGYGIEFQIFAESFLGSIPGNIHPFRDFFWDPSVGNFSPISATGFTDNRMPTGQNVFRQGTTFTDPGATETFALQTIDGRVNFYFMVTAAYGASANFTLSAQNPNQVGSRSNPKYFLPAFHRAEAARVTTTLEDSLGAQDPNSSTILTVSVIDWQGSRSPKGAALAIDDPADTIPFPSDVQQVEVYVPGVVNAPLIHTAPDTGDGSPGNPYIFQFEVANELGADQGIYPGLIVVRDELFDHVPAIPAGVRRDLSPKNIREYSAFQGILVQVGAATAGVYALDPTRTNIDLVDPIFTARTGADVVLDLSVVNQGDPTADGVYFPATGNNGLVRYALDYLTSTSIAPAITPLYTPNIVPDPGNPPPGFDPTFRMPITCLDLGFDATGFAAGTEDFASMRFSHSEDPPGTQTGEQTLTSSMLLYNYYRSTDPPSGIGPVLWFEDLTSAETGQPFAFLPGIYNDNTATPENEFTRSLAEQPIPIDVFEAGDAGDGDSYYGGIWINSQDATNGNRPFQVLRVRGVVPGSIRGLDATGFINQLNFSLPEFSAVHLRAGDMIALGNGTLEVWMAFATNHILAVRWQGTAGLPGSSPEGSPRANISIAAGLPVDMEVLPFDAAHPRTINGQEQASPVLIVLTDSGTIEVLNNVYATSPTLMQSIPLGSAGVLGIPQHVDIDWETWDIHLTTLDAGIPRVTVLSLQ